MSDTAPKTPDLPGRKLVRDRTLDVLRGLAIIVMMSSHFGGRSIWTTVLHLPYWFSAATAFILLAGFLLGRLQAAKPAPVAVLQRAAKLWGVHVVLVLLVLVVHETTGRLRSPSVEALGGTWAALWKTLALRNQPIEYMNILPMYVLFFFLVPPSMAAIRAGKTWVVLTCSLGLWAFAQVMPGWIRFTDPACGPPAFVLFAWQLPFVLGLCAGANWEALVHEHWPRVRRWAVPTLVLHAAVMFVVATLHRSFAARFGVGLAFDGDWYEKAHWGPLRGSYVLSLILLGYLGVEWIRRHRHAWFRYLQPIEYMGRKSLYCFLVHLPLALTVSFFGLRDQPAWLEHLYVPVAILFVYALARHRVLEPYVTLTFSARGSQAT